MLVAKKTDLLNAYEFKHENIIEINKKLGSDLISGVDNGKEFILTCSDGVFPLKEGDVILKGKEISVINKLTFALKYFDVDRYANLKASTIIIATKHFENNNLKHQVRDIKEKVNIIKNEFKG